MEIEDFDLSPDQPGKDTPEEAKPREDKPGETPMARPAGDSGPGAGSIEHSRQSPFALGPLEEQAAGAVPEQAESGTVQESSSQETVPDVEFPKVAEDPSEEEVTERGFYPPPVAPSPPVEYEPSEEVTAPAIATQAVPAASAMPPPPAVPRATQEPGAMLFDQGGDEGFAEAEHGVAGEAQSPARQREGMPALMIAVLIATLVGLSIWAYWHFFRRVSEVEVEVPALVSRPSPTPIERPAPAAPVPVELPPLAESDPFIRGAVAALSARPEILQWLATDSLVERFVATVDNLARGESPRKHLSVLSPKGDFVAEDDLGVVRAAPISYRRYDLLTQVLLSLDTEAVVGSYAQLRPLLEEGYQRLGYPEGDFEVVLAKALQRLNRVEIPLEAPALEVRLKSYHFADPKLEALGEAEKHLLRLGPENGRKVQLKLRQIAHALGLDG